MGIFSRSGAADATAVHARVADGEHLWLAVRGAEGPLVLVGGSGAAGVPDVEVPTEVETHDGETLLTAVLPLAAALAGVDADQVELRLCHGRKARPVVAGWTARPDSPTLAAPTTADGRWQLSVHGAPGEPVVVRRGSVAPSVPVAAIGAVDGGGAVVRLGGPAASVAVAGTTLSVVDGAFVVTTVADLPLDTNVPFEADGVPVVRTRNVMDRPHFATGLPPMPEPEVELRWLRDGRLALHRRETAVVRPIA
jgi:hypothetical protein